MDPAGLERLRAWGGEPLLERMIALFEEHGGGRLEEACGAAGRGDLDRAERAAHSLKSSAANLGAERVRRAAADLERAAASGDEDGTVRLAVRLRRSYDHTVSELARARPGASDEGDP